MTKISFEDIERASCKISDAQSLISDAYTIIEPAMINGELRVGEDKTDIVA